MTLWFLKQKIPQAFYAYRISCLVFFWKKRKKIIASVLTKLDDYFLINNF